MQFGYDLCAAAFYFGVVSLSVSFLNNHKKFGAGISTRLLIYTLIAKPQEGFLILIARSFLQY
jgi:hypothetical protein